MHHYSYENCTNTEHHFVVFFDGRIRGHCGPLGLAIFAQVMFKIAAVLNPIPRNKYTFKEVNSKMDKVLNTLIEAINKNELKAFLMGENGYAFKDKWIETPTDVATIFINGFNVYVNGNIESKLKLESELQKTFIEMLKDPIGTWWTISILYSYLLGYVEGALLFHIDINPLVARINASLKGHKENLRNNKDWVGWRFEGGLWDDVTNMVKRINLKLVDEKSQIRIRIE